MPEIEIPFWLPEMTLRSAVVVPPTVLLDPRIRTPAPPLPAVPRLPELLSLPMKLPAMVVPLTALSMTMPSAAKLKIDKPRIVEPLAAAPVSSRPGPPKAPPTTAMAGLLPLAAKLSSVVALMVTRSVM